MKKQQYTRSILAALIFISSGFVQTSAFELQWFGQATFKLTTETGKVIVIDPFIVKNPSTPEELKDLKKLGDVDLILLTHGHFDHVADAPPLAKLTGAPVGMNSDMGSMYTSLELLSKDQVIRWNKGATITPIGDDIKITMVRADHSSTITTRDKVVHTGGEPVGYIIELENGYKIYHSGDTAVFGDMALIGEYYKPDLALVCIGGHFTMGPEEAAFAMGSLMRPKLVIPMHYGTYPVLKGTPEELIQALGDSPVQVKVMTPGEILRM